MMKTLIKGFIDQGYEISFAKQGDGYVFRIDNGELYSETFEELEEVVFDYIINDADI